MLQLRGQVRLSLFNCADIPISNAQAEVTILHDGSCGEAFGTGDGVLEGKHERKHKSDIAIGKCCHHKFRCAY